jgi:hypothetical protein
LWPVRKNIERVLAQYFGIDFNKVAEEKSALLDETRAKNNA